MSALLARPVIATTGFLTETPVAQSPSGQTGVITRIDLDPSDAAFLRAMGLCVNARIRVCRVGNPCVVAVGGTAGGRCRCGGRCRIGLSRRLAQGIWIAPIADTPGTPDHADTPPSP